MERSSLWLKLCLFCAPTIGKALTEENIKCATLDIDNRFSILPGFHQFDLSKSVWNSEEKFGIIKKNLF